MTSLVLFACTSASAILVIRLAAELLRKDGPR